MRQYYASDKKRREQAQRKKQEEKRLKRLNRNSATQAVNPSAATPETESGSTQLQSTEQKSES